MKSSISCVLILAGMMVGLANGQSRKEIDWSACQAVTDKFKAEVEKFNAEHAKTDGFSIMAGCTYGGDPKVEKKPEIKIKLTTAEIAQLHALNKVRNAAWDALALYEDHLFLAHNIRKPSLGEHCYFFAGIVLDTDFITIDPNPMLTGDDCTPNWRLK